MYFDEEGIAHSINLEPKFCLNCGKKLSSKKFDYCFDCSQKLRRKVERPSRNELKELIRYNSFVSIGRKYHVSDNAIRGWCKAENLPYLAYEIRKMSDEEWEKV